MPRKKNLYQIDRDYLTPPTQSLYQDRDVETSSLPWIQQILEDAADLDDRIAGDFDLDYLKFRIYNNEYGFITTGLILFKIKALKLYANKAKSFKAFCEDHLHKTHWMANKIIRAAKVAIDLIVAGFDVIPRNEAQARTLLAHCEDNLVKAWEFVLEQHEGKLHKITAKSIKRSLVGEEKEEPTMQTMVVTSALYEAIWKVAESQGLKAIEYLEELFLGKQTGDNFAQKLKLEKWEEDLIDLAETG